MSEQRIPPHVAALMTMLGAVGATSIEAIRIPIPDGTPEDQIDNIINAFIEKQQADHRKDCPDCAAEYAADKATQGQTEQVTQGQTEGALPSRLPIGYMVFARKNGEFSPVPNSFNENREAVQKKMETFNALPAIKNIVDLMAMFGQPQVYEIRPVYGD